MRISSVCLLLVLALVVSGTVVTAADYSNQQPQGQKDKSMQTGQTDRPMMQDQAMQLHRATHVIGSDVRNTQNEDLGTINYIVLDRYLNRVSYAVLSYGGVLGVGAKHYAVPWSAIQYQAEGQPVRLNLTKQQLDQDPGFGDQWPDRANTKWGGPMDQGLQRTGAERTVEQPRRDMQQQWDQQKKDAEQLKKDAEQLRKDSEQLKKDTDLESKDLEQTRRDSGTTIRPLEDLGRAPSPDVQSTYGRATEAPPDQATPDQAMEPTARTDSMYERDAAWQTASIDSRKVSEIIGTNVRNPQDDSDLGQIEDLVISRDGRVAYGIISYGGVLGMGEKLAAVPFSELHLDPAMTVAHLDSSRAVLDRLAFDQNNWPDFSSQQYGRRVHENFNAQPYWEKSQMQRDPSAGWTKDCPYQKETFKADQMKTVEGAVQSTSSFHPEAGAYSGLRLRVQATDGSMVTVHVGPRQYVQDQGFTFNKDDKITVKGSQTEFSGQSIIMATEIQKDGKTLQLRDQSGMPKWDVSKMGKMPHEEGK